jgi:phage terminase large subunit
MGDKYAKVLFEPARHKAFYGGRGSAKSWSVATYLVLTAASKRRRIVCARQFQNSIRDSSKELIERRINDLGFAGQFDPTDRSIVHAGTGSEFLFIGLERNVESIRSLEGADIVWVEEARTTKARSLEVLLPTVRNRDSELIWTWNPEDPTDPVDAYFRKGPPPPRAFVTRVDYTDNPFFYQTELPHEMELLKQGNPARYRHVWLGDYDTSYDTKIFSNVTIGRVQPGPDDLPRYGLDFGFGSDPSFIVKLYVFDNRRIVYVAAEACGRVPMEQLPALIRSAGAGADDLIRADSSQPGTIEFLRGRGLNIEGAKKGAGSVKAGINFLQGYRIIIDPTCEGLREEARLYSWMVDRHTQRTLSVPVDANNHGWDAARYAVEDLIFEPPTVSPDGGVLSLKLW